MKLKMRGRLSAMMCLWFALEQTVSAASDAGEGSRNEVSPGAECAGSNGGGCLWQGKSGDDSSQQKMATVSSTVAMSALQVKTISKKSQKEIVNALAEEDATDMEGVEKTQQDELQERWAMAIRWAAHPDKCLQVKGVWEDEEHFRDGTNVELWPCEKRGDGLSQWFLPTSGKGLIRFAYDPTKCLDVAIRSTTDNLQIWSCNKTKIYPNYPGMQFTLPEVSGQIKSGNQCIDIAGGGTSSGTNIWMWNCHDDHPNQQFILGAPPVAIKWATHPNKCLDVSAGMNKDGTNIQLWDCPKEGVHQNMQFLVPNEYGLVRWAKHPDKCLSVAAASYGFESGTNLRLWSCDSEEGGWRFQVPWQGPIRLVDSMMCVDVSGGGTAVGTNIQMWTCVDKGQHPNMQFKIG